MLRCLAAIALLAIVSPAFADDKDKPKPNTLTPKEIAEGWILLFDGETTFGWKIDSAAEVKDGVLVIKGTDWKVRTSTRLDNWELSGEYRVVGKTAAIGLETTNNKDAELGSTILYPVTGEGDKWCPMTLRVRRGEFNVTLNGKKQAPWEERNKVKVEWSDRARFGLLLGSQGGGESHLELRNIKLRPIGSKSLFTGKNLDGWKINAADPKRMASKWTVTKDGELSVKNGPGDLVSEKEFDNFVLQFECKTNGKALNSGIFFRCIPGQYQNGYEAQIQNGYKDNDRTKPADFGTGAIYRRVPARKVVANDNEWFTMTVVADGKHISTWVNGYQTVDWTDDRKEDENPRKGYRAAKGPISIQGHDPTTDILFRNIRIAELPK